MKGAWIKSGIGYRGPIPVLVCSRVANFKTASTFLLDALHWPRP